MIGAREPPTETPLQISRRGVASRHCAIGGSAVRERVTTGGGPAAVVVMLATTVSPALSSNLTMPEVGAAATPATKKAIGSGVEATTRFGLSEVAVTPVSEEVTSAPFSSVPLTWIRAFSLAGNERVIGVPVVLKIVAPFGRSVKSRDRHLRPIIAMSIWICTVCWHIGIPPNSVYPRPLGRRKDDYLLLENGNVAV